MESDEEDEYSSFSYHLQGSLAEIENKLNLTNENKRKSIPNDNWLKELNSRNINGDRMNQIVANYLFIQGYCIPLKKFISESKIKFDFDEKLLNERFLIRKLITNNHIEKAIEEINNIDEKILKENKIMHFILLRQILLNFIKENKLQEALLYAQKNLLPLTEGDDFLFKELEKTMCLLVYDNIGESPDKELITGKFLEKIASKMNLVILNYLSGEKRVNLNLELLIKMMKYTQGQIKKEMDFPNIISLSPLQFSIVNK